MTREEIAKRIRAWLGQEFPNPGVELQDTTDLLREWFVDSLGVVMTVTFLEREFGVEVGRSEITAENFANVGLLSRYVHAKRSGGEN